MVAVGVQHLTDRWDRHFLDLALAHARMSKDPSTQVGAIIVGPDREVRSAGFNGFPRGIADTPERLANRDLKYSLIVHGEMNAVLAAARIGVSVKGCVLYIAATNSSGIVWGGPPCTRCTVEIIQAGITEIVAHSSAAIPDRWRKSADDARALLAEAGLGYREV
jgi:dCMP deaminase